MSVTINGITKYYSKTIADNDNAFLNSTQNRMYVEDHYFYQQWGIFSSHTQYGIIDNAEMNAFESGKMAPAAYTYLMRLTYAWYLADSVNEQDALLQEANWFRGTGYTDIYFDSILCIDEDAFNEFIEYMPTLPTSELTQEQHYFRNNLNIEYNWGTFETLQQKLPDELKRNELPWYQSVFHKFGQIDNRKYISPNGHFEMVFSEENELVDEAFSPTNMGTYNYYGPNQDKSLHTDYDVITWAKWGNVPS